MRHFFYILLPIVLVSQTGFARKKVVLVEPDAEKTSALTLSADLLGMYYKEYLPPPTDTEEGILGGANVEFLTLLAHRWMLRFAFDLNFGKTKYVGALQDGTPITSTTNIFIFDGEFAAGYQFSLSDSLKLVPYLGFGTHYWYRGLTGLGAYTEKYLFFYLPVGAKLEKRFDNFEIDLDASLHWNLGGSIQVLLSELNPPEKDASGSLGSALGCRIQVPVSFHLSPSFRLKAIPFFDYFGIGQGEPFPTFSASGQNLGNSYEPESATYLYGGRVGLEYDF